MSATVSTGILNTTVYTILCHAELIPYNITHRPHSTVSGIAAYRSALTLDWLAHQDNRQRGLAHVFEKEGTLYKEADHSECLTAERPSGGKAARLMLELLKNLEGDDGVIQELTLSLIRADILVETSQMDVEPNLDSLVQTARLMQGEPHATLPRILAVVWLLASDPITTQTNGWCSIKKLIQYLKTTSSAEIAAHMRTVDPIVARARFMMEAFMQHAAPLQLHLKRDARPPEFRKRGTRISLRTSDQLRRRTANEDSIPEDGTKVTQQFLPTAERPVSLSNDKNAAYFVCSNICLVVTLCCDLVM